MVRELNPTLDEATSQQFDEAQRTVVAAMGDLEEEPMPLAFNFIGRLGSGPARCIRHAVLGSGPGLNASAFPYRPLTTLTFTGCHIQDGGVTNIAEILKPSAATCQVRDPIECSNVWVKYTVLRSFAAINLSIHHACALCFHKTTFPGQRGSAHVVDYYRRQHDQGRL